MRAIPEYRIPSSIKTTCGVPNSATQSRFCFFAFANAGPVRHLQYVWFIPRRQRQFALGNRFKRLELYVDLPWLNQIS